MSQAASHAAPHAVEAAETPLTPESWGKLGMWIFLAGDAVGFGTSFFIVTGFHGMHVTAGVIYLLAVIGVVSKRPDPAASYNVVEIVGLYWHFVDLVWIMVFTFMYLL